MGSLARRARTVGRWAWQHFRLVAGIGLVVGLTLTLVANRDAIAAVDWTIDPLALGAAMALLAVAPLAQALTPRIALGRLGAARPTLLGDRLARWLSRRGVAVAGPMRGRTLALMIAVNAAGWAASVTGAWVLADRCSAPRRRPGSSCSARLRWRA